VATGALPSAGVPLSAIATPTAYAVPAYSPYAAHAPLSEPAWARPVFKAVEQPSSICIDPVRPGHSGTREAYKLSSFFSSRVSGNSKKNLMFFRLYKLTPTSN